MRLQWIRNTKGELRGVALLRGEGAVKPEVEIEPWRICATVRVPGRRSRSCWAMVSVLRRCMRKLGACVMTATALQPSCSARRMPFISVINV
jgi:hypothetical protein